MLPAVTCYRIVGLFLVWKLRTAPWAFMYSVCVCTRAHVYTCVLARERDLFLISAHTRMELLGHVVTRHLTSEEP